MMDELSALPPENWKPVRQPRQSNLSTMVPKEEGPISGSLSGGQKQTVFSTHSDRPFIVAPTPRRHLIESSASRHWLYNPAITPPSSRPASALSQTDKHHYSHSTRGGISQVYGGPGSSQSPALSSTLQSNINTPPSVIRRRRFSNSASYQPGKLPEVPEHETGEEEHIGHNNPGFGSHGLPHSSSDGTGRMTSGGLRMFAPMPAESGMGRRWIRWMHKWGLKQWVVPSSICVASLVKFAIGLGSYSGQNSPPMYGDYEAQRHWMEITKHLPLRQWYTHDLQYWGLDYPPLTAYVSWLCGIIAHFIKPSWVALDTSRGIESPEIKVFLRLSVIVLDLLVYVPALLWFSWSWQGSRSKRTQELAFLTLLLQPALLLIDFGHFQYNSVMLGFALHAINCFAMGRDLLGAFFFVLSLGFKQMALYFAPAIGSYLLAKCFYVGSGAGIRLFVRLGIVSLSTFVILFLPWLPPFASFSSIMQPIVRIFPFARGLFEDKVANFWCASNVVFKWKTIMSPGTLVKLSTLLTAVGFLPTVVGLLRAGITMGRSNRNIDSEQELSHNPTAFLPLLPYALLNSSLSFFLFSFQVHEKTILVPLLPMTLLLSSASVDSVVYHWGILFNNIAVFSMWPLLKRDGLGVQYIATLMLWNRLLGFNPLNLRPKTLVEFVSMCVYTVGALLHILEITMKPPSRYPDFFSVLNVLISTPVFVLIWLWSIKCGIEIQWALGGLGRNGPGSIGRRVNSEDPMNRPSS